jgi:hypothetical protein
MGLRDHATSWPDDTFRSTGNLNRPGFCPSKDMSQPKPLLQRSFEGKSEITIGRAADDAIQLDGLLVSSYQARVVASQGVLIEDLNSTNGVYANGSRIIGKHRVQPWTSSR